MLKGVNYLCVDTCSQETLVMNLKVVFIDLFFDHM